MSVNQNKVYELHLLNSNITQVLLNSFNSCPHTADTHSH